MKQQITKMLFAVYIVIALNNNLAFGQSTTATNALTGASSSTPNQFLGSNNNFDVVFKVNNVEKMRLQGSNLGIGTTSPGTPLEVKTGVGAFGFSHTDGTRQLTSYVDATGGMIGTSSNDPLQLYTNNNTVFTLSTSGNANLNGSANAYQIKWQ